MAVARNIDYASVDDLFLDPTNPRLGRANTGPDVPQNRILDLMKTWSLEELAVSFMENHFWPQEALIAVREELYGQPNLIVVEGNRRLAALKLLKRAAEGDPISRRWGQIAQSGEIPPDLFTTVPYLLVDDRSELVTFLGFRHVTGIKEWAPAEKAEYITRLILQEQMEPLEVTRRIGSRLEAVKRNYVSYQILRQMEALDQADVSLARVEDRFSVLFLSLRETVIRDFLGVDLEAPPEQNQTPVPDEKHDNLVSFARWLFGNENIPPLITDSRQIKDFARILDNEEALDYLRNADVPMFEIARRKSGAALEEALAHVQSAIDQIELALSTAYLHVNSPEFQDSIDRLGRSVSALQQSLQEAGGEQPAPVPAQENPA
jgi:hypothetical protein